jgi:hypothetical protein
MNLKQLIQILILILGSIIMTIGLFVDIDIKNKKLRHVIYFVCGFITPFLVAGAIIITIE